MHTTKPTKISDITRTWHLIDVKDKVLGRIATDIALALMGKSKPYFVRNLDCGDFIVVVNAKYVATTGKKEKQKLYGNFSGFPGGLKQKALWQMRAEKPTEIIRHAVWGMLPKNKLRDRLITRLYIYPEAEHPYKDKIKN
ncbi:50S ribosomal protein L13 [Candidatus Gottesmanbacteria bacterium RIFCSPLOWO2_01_FULL_48_11]|uniref:Large ribosomal subunit protein uL13 n=3 Tax=Candidatus Gottesmaniibacteriota TaxID=1752720 RepID=A0A0G1WZS3_9BACT|nr:MAG: 50S ribosomal protein L13 [Candidatus Gottesmanbacteria bacterium GW2011_GWA2_47_9]KKU95818.1 MAG: 50S ribosomal protein L13 [Candidatus Gottesmanbacteria bacterium GW2011_GWA1_48_13]OGG28442.1 MAG: 50S ribosomal protein L13 [Candidatus Gottesmanbacteria bacterium RIFCSPLOWO2_01_FULL_48_11]